MAESWDVAKLQADQAGRAPEMPNEAPREEPLYRKLPSHWPQIRPSVRDAIRAQEYHKLPPLINASELAMLLRVSPLTVSRNRDQFPVYRVGRRLFFATAEVLKQLGI